MSETYDKALVPAFNALLHVELDGDKEMPQNYIDPTSIHRNVKGETDHFDRLANVVASKVTGRHVDLTPLNPESSKRMSRVVWIDAPVFLDTYDQVRSLIDAQNGYRTIMARAVKNQVVKDFLDAAVGSAALGIQGADGTQVLPSGQKIAVNSGANQYMTKDKIDLAHSGLSRYGVPQGAKNRLAFYAPGHEPAMLDITQAVSSDFTRQNIIDRGGFDGVEWMGFTWKMIADVYKEGADGITKIQTMLPLSSTTRTAIFMSRMAVGMTIGKDINTVIKEIAMKRDAILVRPEVMCGFVRIWDTGVISVDATDAFA